MTRVRAVLAVALMLALTVLGALGPTSAAASVRHCADDGVQATWLTGQSGEIYVVESLVIAGLAGCSGAVVTATIDHGNAQLEVRRVVDSGASIELDLSAAHLPAHDVSGLSVAVVTTEGEQVGPAPVPGPSGRAPAEQAPGAQVGPVPSAETIREGSGAAMPMTGTWVIWMLPIAIALACGGAWLRRTAHGAGNG